VLSVNRPLRPGLQATEHLGSWSPTLGLGKAGPTAFLCTRSIKPSSPQEEELKKAKEEEERREYEEYLKLKESFVVEEEGVDETLTEEQSQSFVSELLNYIKNSKVVLLEDLASHLGLRTQDAINRVQDLMADGTLTGVIDDRGKFIYITPEELMAVAEFIRRRGRVSITELAQESNSLINLEAEAGFLSKGVA
ncbi:DDRGK domain-containing protein 1, partial [Thamnophis elegans]|uniref:DDRGK domain-containing protein 1 n=1 Tax=Thamnophis elegans TaxID=35005 RepID=UPI001377FA9B